MRKERCKNYDLEFTGIEIPLTPNPLAGAVAKHDKFFDIARLSLLDNRHSNFWVGTGCCNTV
jgi:hypothetical protein